MTKVPDSILPEEFNLRNLDLATIICEAAIEIDNHIIGRDKLKYNNISRLRKLLYNLASDQCGLTSYLTVLKEPIENYIEEKFDNRAKIEDLAKELNKVCNDLESIVLLHKKRQENLRKFCVDLSKKTMDYREMYFSSRRYLVA